MRFTRLLVPSLLAVAALGAADPQAGTPAVSAQLADGATLAVDWQKSLYGKVWNDQALADTRADTDAELAKLKDDLGFDPLAAFLAMKGAALTLTGISAGADGKPQAHAQMGADLGDFAARIMKLVQSRAGKDVKAAQVPGADEALAFSDPKNGNTVTLARFASRLSIGVNDAPKATSPVAGPAKADAVCDVDLPALIAAAIAAMPADQAATFKQQVADNPMLKQGGALHYQADLVPEGVHEGMTFATPVKANGSRPVDRDLLARLPGTALLTIAMGVDGKGMWAQNGHAWMAQAATASNKESGDDLTPDDMEKRINQQMQGFGLTCTLAELVSSIDGSVVISVCQGAPFPSATIVIPRSKEVDQVIDLAMKQMGGTAPAVGQSTMLPMPPQLPVAVNLICDAKSWVISSDSDVASTWTNNQPGGWAETSAGKQALAASDAAEKAGGKAYLIGASDTASVLRTVSGYLNTYLSMQKDMDPKQKQEIIHGLGRLAAIASPGYVVATTGDQGMAADSRGLFGFIGIPIAAGVAAGIKNAAMHAGAANEQAVVGLLKGPIFKAEVEFQQKGYVDQDGNGIGEYGLLSELGGKRPLAKPNELHLVNGEVAAGHAHGYHFAVFLPDAGGGAVAEPDNLDKRAPVAAAAPLQEKHFVAYAWPDDEKAGKHMFAITEAGEVRQAMYFGDAPAWGDLFDGTGWNSPATWEATTIDGARDPAGAKP
jgi:hypothetical protein